MIYDEIKSKEDSFAEKLRDSYGKVFTTKESDIIPGAIRLVNPNDDWYYKVKTKKDKIVLHFTAGILHGDIGELTRQHVSVPYVLSRGAEIYELFDPEYYSYHLGPGSVGGNTKQSKSSIGIEISNYGPLTLDSEAGTLLTWSGKPYCLLSQEEAYVKASFRGSDYFATYTDEQYRKLDSLITNLCREFNILRKLPDVAERELTFVGNPPGEGIWSHQNFRKSKSDVGPAFDWSRISGR